MNFELSKEHQLLRQMYREFAENEVKPLAEEIDEEERFPMETVEKLGKLGMMGIYFPKQYGGAGADVLAYAMAVEELSKVCGTTGVIVSAHTSLCCAPIFENGNEEQKMKYLPKLCSGEWIGAFGLTEPGAGTDAQGQQTTAVLDEKGENWILNGSKIFITNAGYASVFVIIAVTGTIEKNGRKLKEISRHHQIICITHLPQIAACGDHHYRIYKESDESRTFTTVEAMNPDEQVREIARLLGGDHITETTLQSARELIESSFC